LVNQRGGQSEPKACASRLERPHSVQPVLRLSEPAPTLADQKAHRAKQEGVCIMILQKKPNQIIADFQPVFVLFRIRRNKCRGGSACQPTRILCCCKNLVQQILTTCHALRAILRERLRPGRENQDALIVPGFDNI
jgi:hypothetical protein